MGLKRPANQMVHPAKQTKTVRRPAAASVADLRAEIRRHGMRSTGARLAVLAHLNQASAPLSHTEIFAALEERGYDRATIYRNLIDLAEGGLLARSDHGDHIWRFERMRGAGGGHSQTHPHFVCVDCGGVTCLPDLTVKFEPASSAPRALRTRKVEVQMKGLCDSCT